jgi:hypothetical protein
MSRHTRTPRLLHNAQAITGTTAYPSPVIETNGEVLDVLATAETTSTATGSWQWWINNKPKNEYDADVVAAGSEAANVAGWVLHGAAIPITAAFKSSLPQLTLMAARARGVYTNATNSGALTTRLAIAPSA